MIDTIIDKGMQLGFWDNDKPVEVVGKGEVVQESLDDASKIKEIWDALPPNKLSTKGGERL